MAKRIIVFFSVFVFLFSFAACYKKQQNKTDASTTESTTMETVNNATSSNTAAKYKILGEKYQTVVTEFLQDGYDVIDGLSSQVGANKTISERRAGWYKNINNFSVSIPNNLLIHTAYSVEEAAWVLMFVESDVIVAYHILLGLDPANTVENCIKNSSFYEIKSLKIPPKMERLYGRNDNVDKEWNHNYNGRLIYAETDYSVQAKVAKLDLANNAELTSDIQKMGVLEFYVEADRQSAEKNPTTQTGENDATHTTTDKENSNSNSVTDVITGVHTYTGTIKAGGLLSCCLELETAISFLDPLDTSPITSNQLWIDENNAEYFSAAYNGKIVTLKGELFNYRGGGTLMFKGAPQVLKVSGTSNIVPVPETEDTNSNASNTPTLTQDELDQIMLDEAGVPDNLRFETWVPYPEVTLSGYMKSSTIFIPDEKVAIKGYWQKNQWDVLDSFSVAVQYKLEPSKRYTFKGVLRYDSLQSIEIIEQHN